MSETAAEIFWNTGAQVGLVTWQTRQKPELYDSWAFTNQDYFRDPNGLPDLTALQASTARFGLARRPRRLSSPTTSVAFTTA